MDCPRCGAETHGASECPRCGVVVRKARPPLPPPAAPHRPPQRHAGLAQPDPPGVRPARAGPRRCRPPVRRGRRVPPRSQRDPRRLPHGRGSEYLDEPPDLAATLARPVPDPPTVRTEVPAADVAADDQLWRRTAHRATDLGPDILRWPRTSTGPRPDSGRGAAGRRPAPKAASQERRALAVRGGGRAPRTRPRRHTREPRWRRARCWPSASTRPIGRRPSESRATSSSATPRDPEATRALAYALVRQDRAREAIEIAEPFAPSLDGAARIPAATRPTRADHARPGRRVPAAASRRSRTSTCATTAPPTRTSDARVLRVLERHYATLR